MLGCFAGRLSGWLARKRAGVAAANVGRGITFVSAGLSIMAREPRR